MPQIIVTAGPTGEHGGDVVMLRERVNPADFESETFATNLVERLGWAVGDATEAERREPNGFVPDQDVEHGRAPEPSPLVTA
jgi:hypothetical protein